MDPERWQRIDGLFQALVDLDPEAQRAGLAAEPDEEIRAEVGEMLDVVLDETWDGEAGDPDDALGRIVQAGWAADGEDEDADSAPDQVGPYRLVREIGRGGMATVYLAERDGEFTRKVAVKLIRRGLDTEDILERLRLERQILAHLDHPYIARMFEGGTTDDGRPYFVMEAIEGERIDRWCESRGATLPERLELFRKVCEAVDYAHQNLVLHRDIKPSNILVTADGTPKLLDFGIAKVLDPGSGPVGDDPLSGMPTLTRPGERLLTPEFASPEQVRGTALTTAADVYSLGVVLFELVTGRRPYAFPRADFAEVLRIVEEANPERPSLVAQKARRDGDSVPGPWPSGSRAEDLDNVTLMALRKEPERRYGSARELAEDLRRLQEDLPVRARKDTLRYRSVKFMRRNRNLVGTAAAIFLTLLGAVIVTTNQARIAREETRNTRQMYAFLENILVNADPYNTLGEALSVLEVLDGAAEKIEKDFDSSPEVEADLLTLVGTIYRNMSRYDEAVDLFSRAAEIRRGFQAPESLVGSLVELGQSLIFAGRSNESLPFLEEALDLHGERADPILRAENLMWLAEATADGGDLETAETLFQQALDIHPTATEAEDSLATLFHNVGQFNSDRGRVAEARTWFEKSIELRLKGKDPQHPEVLDNLNELAIITGQLDGREAAAEAYRDLLPKTLKIFGPDHIRTAKIHLNLGTTLSNLVGRRDEGLEHLELALDIAGRIYDESHFELAPYYRNLALNHQVGKDYEQAWFYADKAFRSTAKEYGAEHGQTLHSRIKAAHLASLKGDPTAESELEDTAAVVRRVIVGDDGRLARVLFYLGEHRLRSNQASAAEDVLRESWHMMQRLNGPEFWFTAQIQGELGHCLLAQGKSDEGEGLLRQAFATFSSTRGDDHPRTRKVLEHLKRYGIEPRGPIP